MSAVGRRLQVRLHMYIYMCTRECMPDGDGAAASPGQPARRPLAHDVACIRGGVFMVSGRVVGVLCVAGASPACAVARGLGLYIHMLASCRSVRARRHDGVVVVPRMIVHVGAYALGGGTLCVLVRGLWRVGVLVCMAWRVVLRLDRC